MNNTLPPYNREDELETPSDGFFADVAPEDTEIPHSPIPVIPELGVALGLLVLVLGITYFSIPTADTQLAAEEMYTEPSTVTETPPRHGAAAFEGITLHAQSAIVWDVREGVVLFEKNADDTLPLASLTKLMTALVAYELMDPADRITISQAALRTEGDSGFVAGESFSLRDLTDIMLVASSNDGAAAIGASAASAILSSSDPEDLFVHAMNIRAQELNLSKTQFRNTTGLDLSETEASAYGSARDVARLMEYILLNAPDIAAQTTQGTIRVQSESGAYHTVKNTNDAASTIAGLIASKTGYTTLAGGNLAIAFDAGLNRPIVVVVMGSTYSNRFTDASTLVEETRRHLTAE